MTKTRRKRSAASAPLEPQPGPFPYADYVQALEEFQAARDSGPFYGVVSGPSGMGKSSLLHALAGTADAHRFQAVYLSSSRANVTNVVRFLAYSLRVAPCRSHLETVQAFANALRSQPAHLVVHVDEADRVDPEALQELRVLAECDASGKQLFSVVLSGLPGVLSLLDSPALFPLKRRLSVRAQLCGLRRKELEPFLLHRLGVDAERVPTAVHDELFERTQGAPGLIEGALRMPLARVKGRLSTDQVRAGLDPLGL
jgi:type II secretory pathway predicted ATPase ExeA